MSKYIDAEKLIAEIERLIKVNKELKSSRFTEGIAAGYGDVLSAITSLQQDKETLELCSLIWWEEQGWIMIPPDATIEGIDSLLRQVKKKLQQEQRDTDGDDGKFVKILVRKEFAEQIQKLGDEIQAGQSYFVGAMNQKEKPNWEEILEFAHNKG